MENKKDLAKRRNKKVEDLLSLYRDASLWVRFHNYVRLRTCPFERVADYIPEKGKILELGCGYGLMSNLLAIEGPERDVTGIDISFEKIKVAEKSIKFRKNIHFKVSDIYNPKIFENEKYGCIIILDVLYLVPIEKWGIIFGNCFHALETGGIFLLKEQDTEPRWKYYWNRFQEFLAVRILKITQGETFVFPDEDTVKGILKLKGFSVESVKLQRGYMHPHILFVCRK